jgi:hypothetical protein
MIPSLLDNNDDDDDDDDDERRSERSHKKFRETHSQKVDITRQRTIWKDYKIMPSTKTNIKRSKCCSKEKVLCLSQMNIILMK